jgi:hypothetical protein
MVIGKRTNVNMSFVTNQALHIPGEVRRVARIHGKLFRSDAVDFFFIKGNIFPWHLVPDLAVGRKAYDNFIVAIGISNNVSVVDASNTITAIHQTDFEGIGAGHRSVESEINVEAIGPFDYSKGKTTSCNYYSHFHGFSHDSSRMENSITILRRHVTSIRQSASVILSMNVAESPRQHT